MKEKVGRGPTVYYASLHPEDDSDLNEISRTLAKQGDLGYGI